MKMHVQRVVTSQNVPFELESLRQHLRVSDGSEDIDIAQIGRTAAADLEHMAQIALLSQDIKISIFGATLGEGMSLPIGPVSEAKNPFIHWDDEPFGGFVFVDGNRPYIHWDAEFQGKCPTRLDIDYEAGFGTDASFIPFDLSQAIMDQAALHYDGRAPMDAKALTSSPHMARIAAKYRGVQL